MQWKHLPIVAFDTETTGFEPFNGDRVIEFAAVVLHLDDEGRIQDRSEHSWLINPTISIPRVVSDLTGIRDHDVADKPRFEEVASDIAVLFEGCILVAHNLHFDRNFLNAELGRMKRHLPVPEAEIDTLTLSQRLFPKAAEGHKLAQLGNRLGLRLEGAHRAVNDAGLCGDAFAILARRDNIDDDMEALLQWSQGVGRPDPTSPFSVSDVGVVFSDGEFAGELLDDHPIQLAWMAKQRRKTSDGWQHVLSESHRRWVHRWLSARGEGIATVNAKSFHATDWVVDCCIGN
jgi:DNA polymerase III epsilon subunit family exonuclease